MITPRLMSHPCRYPGCNALITKPGWCERHSASRHQAKRDYDKHIRSNDPALSLAARIRSSLRWRKARAIQLSQYPICADPFGVHRDDTATAKQVHHIKGLATHPELAYSPDNLMSICTKCHARIEQEVRISDEPIEIHSQQCEPIRYF